MDIRTLESFRLSDAITFHDNLNPKLWTGMKLRFEVKTQLKKIADDFLTELGISGLDVKDLTISGSNAAYSYTPHSDLDLHILLDFDELPNDDVYRELFQAKKTVYNDSHNIKIHGIDVELYVQDTNEPVISLGEYSILNDKWLKIPIKRRANFDQNATKAKYNKLHELIRHALKSKQLSSVKKVISKIKKYRQAGLDKGGEFSPENLAYKALRNQDYITRLYDLRDKLHSEELTIETMYTNPVKNKLLNKPTLSVKSLAEKHKVSTQHILNQLKKGIEVEKEHTTYKQTAREIALDHLAEDPNYYTKLKKANLEEEQKIELPEKVYYVAKAINVDRIEKSGITPKKSTIYCFPDKNAMQKAIDTWLPAKFGVNTKLAVLEIDTDGLEGKVVLGAKYEIRITEKIPSSKIRVLSKNLATNIQESLDILEVLDTPATSVKWDSSDPENVEARFTSSNGVPYILTIMAPYMGPDEIKPYDFFDNLSDELEDSARFVEFSIGTGEWGGEKKQGIEGTGSAAEVFGIVTNALLQYANKKKPSMLYFQAAEPSRQKLYKTIINRVLRGLPNYAVKQKDDSFALYNKKLFKKQGVAEDIDYQRHLKLINAHMKKMGYRRLGGGRDAQVYAKQEGNIIKILIPQDEKNVRSAEIPFLEFYKYCQANKKNPHLPKFGKIQGQDYTDFYLDGERFVQIAQERLSDIPAPSEYDDMLFDMINSVENNTPLEQKYPGYELFYKTLKSVAQRGRELGFENDFIKSDDDFNIMLRGKTLVITDPWLDASFNEGVGENKSITESLNQPYELVGWDDESYDDEIRTYAALPDGTHLEILFSREDEDFNEWDAEFRRGDSMLKTGQGLAPQIFATVLEAIKQFIKKVKPVEIRFSATKKDDPTGSRSRLYDGLAKRYAAGLGYSFQTKDDAFDRNYVFRKIRRGVTEGYLNEHRKGLYNFIKNKFPTWPEYVLKDFLYSQAKHIQNQEELKNWLDRNQRDFGQVKWRLEKLPITIDIFTPKTQRMIKQREGGSSNPFQVPRDAERHAQQLKMIQQQGVRTEPIIVAKLNNGYDLIEGWHRTIQHLQQFPEGYTGPAWVAYGATYTSESKQGVAESVGDDDVDQITNDFIKHYSDDPLSIFMQAKASYLYAVERAKDFSNKAYDLYRSHGNMSREEFQNTVMKYFGKHLRNNGFPQHASKAWAEAEHQLRNELMNSDQLGVTESFDQPYRLSWKMGVHGDVDAYATLPDGTPLSIMFNQENEHFWTVEFYRSNSQGVTGEGDSQRIFATVLGAIKKFVKKYQPRYIVFSAVKEDDPTGSRAKLYERMVQKYARQLGYEIEVLDEGYRTTFTLYQSESLNEQDVMEGKNNDTAISLSRLGRFHKGQDTLAEFVPERATARYALHPEKWESTFFSLTNKDPRKLKYFGPKEISIPPGTLVGDMAIANRFYRAETAEEKQKYAEAYRQSLKPYPVDVSQYRMPELLIPQQGVAEGR